MRPLLGQLCWTEEKRKKLLTQWFIRETQLAPQDFSEFGFYVLNWNLETLVLHVLGADMAFFGALFI